MHILVVVLPLIESRADGVHGTISANGASPGINATTNTWEDSGRFGKYSIRLLHGTGDESFQHQIAV